MAHVLRITDGTTTVTFTSGNMYLGSYVPQVSYSGEPIQESATVGFTGGLTAIRSNIQAINRLFVQASNYHRNRSGARVYIEFDPNSSGTAYRSQVYTGMVELTDDTLGGQWGAANLELDLSWTRQPFWEGALTQIPLTNSSTDMTTDYIAVNNRNDGSGENWFSIASTDIAGDLPAPLKLEMVNATTDANATDEIFLWHNVYSDPENFVHFLEGEASTDASSTTDAGSNAAAYGSFTWATTDETRIAVWPIPTSDLDDAQGGRFGVLARWPAVFPYTDAWLRLKLETATTYNDLWVGELNRVSPTTDVDTMREMHLLDTMRLPPYLYGQSSIKGIVLSLYALRGSTDNTINIDYLQLSPVSADAGWKRFKSVDQGVGIDETFIHDDIEGYTYKQDSSGNAISEFADYGGPIMLVPNAVQKIYINTCDYLGAAEVTQTWNVKLYYRPRRDSL